MLNIIWRDTALEDLRSVVSYSFERNPVAAAKMDSLITQSAEKLAESPYMGRIGRVSGTREFVMHPNYILVYKIMIGELHIIRVLHGSRKYP